ncbi:curli-like amyloid fiber formation chaperone CsgH [Mesorhizobium sp. KR1-2]|uniref:curli-like amyloid fiber formation chaperone CsgH n=1 Tax=Mesorhizobium sp. KR1-2 TaxID=3156609 RepID=UPI0032B4D3B9
MYNAKLVLAAFMSLAVPTIAAAGGDNAVLPMIELRHIDGSLEIVGKALALSDSNVSGELVINRSGQAGTVSSQQGGTLELIAGQVANIAKVNVSYADGDKLDVTLILSRDGIFVARSILSTEE